ncbi:hypothetical protein LguiB_005190 [Lonicera macranthoides]
MKPFTNELVFMPASSLRLVQIENFGSFQIHTKKKFSNSKSPLDLLYLLRLYSS